MLAGGLLSFCWRHQGTSHTLMLGVSTMIALPSALRSLSFSASYVDGKQQWS